MKLFNLLKNELQKITFFRSLKFRVFAIIFLTGLICCFVMRYGIIQSYFERAIKVRTSSVQNQMVILADHLLTYNYLNDPSSNVVNAELEQLTDIYDGRVLVVDSNCKVIYDTYTTSVDKYMIAEEVIRSFKGETISNYDDENQIIEMTIPISKSDEEGNKTVVGVIFASISADSLIENQSILDRQALIMNILLLLLVSGAALGAPYILLRPFDKLTSAIGDIKAGFSDERIEVKDCIETEHIGDAFNQMLDRMKIVDDSRNEFVSNVSHELKTPLTSIKVLADSLNTMEGAPIEMYQEFMTDIVDEVDRETKIVNDLLALVRMDKSDKNNNNLNIAIIDINQLIDSIFKRLGPIAKQNKIDLIFESNREVTAEIDEVKFTLALSNLIENGIKYNNDNGYVKVILDADHQYFTVIVEDSGMGIDEEEQKHIFERFYRVDKSHSTQISGSGLGLAITRSAILRHRGSIKVNSALGEGTTFTVKIPLTYVQSKESK